MFSGNMQSFSDKHALSYYFASLINNRNIQNRANIPSPSLPSLPPPPPPPLVAPAVIKNSVCMNAYVGDYKLSCRTTDFDGWMVCDGRTLLASMYPSLYNIISMSFSPGCSLTSGMFSLPDARGCVLGGVSPAMQFGSYHGSSTHVIMPSEMPSHSHTGWTDKAGAHSHGVNDATFPHTHSGSTCVQPTECKTVDGQYVSCADDISTNAARISVSPVANHTHTFVTSTSGASKPMSLMQPTLFAGSLFIFTGIYNE